MRASSALARRGPIGPSLQRAIEQRFSDVARLRNAGSDLVFPVPGVCLLRLLPAPMRSNFTAVTLMRSGYSRHVGGWRQPHRGSASPS
jgi:hypothetical protein